MTPFKFIRKWLSRKAEDQQLLAVGSRVRVARTCRSPLPGELGSIIDVSLDHRVGPFLVLFANGLQYRYSAPELEVVSGASALEVERKGSRLMSSLTLKRARR